MSISRPELQYQPNIDLDLGTARSNVEVQIGGTGLTLVGATGQVYVRLNEPQNPIIDMNKAFSVTGQFYRIFITNTAQAGLVATLLVNSPSMSQTGIIPVSNTISGLPGTLVQVGLTPTVYNVTMTLTDTEYSQVLPTNTKRITAHVQDDSVAFRLAYATGEVAGPTAPYINVLLNGYYVEDSLLLPAGTTLYFACTAVGKIMEIIVWV